MFVDFNYQPIIEDFNKNGTLKLAIPKKEEQKALPEKRYIQIDD